MAFRNRTTGNFNDVGFRPAIEFSTCIIGIYITFQISNAADTFIYKQFYSICDCSRTNTVCSGRLFMSKNFSMDFIQINNDLASATHSP